MPDFYFINRDRRVTEFLESTSFDFDHSCRGFYSDQVVFRLMVGRAWHRRGRSHAKYRNKTAFSLDASEGMTMVMAMQHQFRAVPGQNLCDGFGIVQATPESRATP